MAKEASNFNKDPLRPKRLLLHKKDIMRLLGRIREKVIRSRREAERDFKVRNL